MHAPRRMPRRIARSAAKTVCGAAADSGMIYTEIILKKENFTMNSLIKAGHPTALKT